MRCSNVTMISVLFVTTAFRHGICRVCCEEGARQAALFSGGGAKGRLDRIVAGLEGLL